MSEPYILVIGEGGKLLYADDKAWEIFKSSSHQTDYESKGNLIAQGLGEVLKESAGTIDLGGKNYRFTKIQWGNKFEGNVYLIKIYPAEDELINFFSILIHEFKNPLGAIRALAQSLEAKFKDSTGQREKIRAYTGRIIKEIDRLNSLLASVKYVSRPLIQDMQEFDLAGVMKEAVELYREELGQKGIQIEGSLGREMVPFWGTPDDFHQILSNLIKNAEEALVGAKDGKITVALRSTDDTVEIEVVDNGSGIDDEVLERIGRRPFASTKPSGMGMGLYVVETLLEKYKGDLSLCKGPRSCGTVAKVTLSLRKNQVLH